MMFTKMLLSLYWTICLHILYYGNRNTTYTNQYGQTTGNAKTSTDYYGNINTTYSNPYGQTTGSEKTSTDYYGNVKTTYYDQYGRTQN